VRACSIYISTLPYITLSGNYYFFCHYVLNI